MPLGLRHGTEPPDKAGHKAEDHAQQQGQRRDDAAKEVHHLVRGDDIGDADEPQRHGAEHGAGGQTVEQALQRQRIAGGQVGQNGDALVDKGGVHRRRQQGHGQQPQQVAAQALAAQQTGNIPPAAQRRQNQAHRVHKKHGADDDQGEIGKAHRRMASAQRIVHGITSCIHDVLTF